MKRYVTVYASTVINWTPVSKLRVFGLLLIFFVLCTSQSCHLSRQNSSDEYYAVTNVVDGDTFWIDDGSERGLKIRLIGVDAPETRKSARKEIGHYGEEAKRYLTELLLNQEVRLE